MKQTIKINASSIPHSKCILHWHREVIQGYKQPRQKSNLRYGVAGHAYIDAMFKTGGNMRAARDKALEVFRVPKIDDRKKLWLSDERHFLATCYMVWEEFILKDTQFDIIQLPTGKPATEVTFSLPFYEDEDFIVRLEGTIDKLGKIKGGCYSNGDYKFTSSYDVDGYLADYEMSSPLRFYANALYVMGQLEPDSVLGKIGQTNVGSFIDGIFLKPKPSEVICARSEVFIFKDMDEYRALLFAAVKRLLYAIKTDTWNIREGIFNGSCDQKFAHCPFWFACKAADKTIAEILLKRDFIQVAYNPLNHEAT